MPRLKYFNDSTQQWEYVVVGAQGPQGQQGPQGDTGATGAQGDTGPAGPGLAAGGTAGQIIAKVDGTDYNTEWIDNYTEQVKHTVKAGESLTKGQAVYVSSSNGTNMVVSKASNNAESTSSKTMGLIAQTLANNGQGFVVTEGLLAGLNTASATAGDPVWLGTSGNILYGLSNKPTAPAHLVFIGIVTRVHATNGEIFVKVQNGFELNELHDVSITSPAAGELVVRNSSNTLWENMTKAEAGFATVATSGSYNDLSDKPITASSGQVLYQNGSNATVGSSGLAYDGVSLKVNGNLESTYASGDEGGEIFLNKPVTNTSITNGVTIDVWQNRLRIFENGGSYRGYHIDITGAAGSVGSNLNPGLNPIIPSSINVTSGSASAAATGRISFSGTGLIRLNGIFTSTYKTYKMRMVITSGANDYIGWRFCSGGTATSGSSYSGGMAYIQTTTFGLAYNQQNAAFAQIGYCSNGGQFNHYDLDVFNPNDGYGSTTALTGYGNTKLWGGHSWYSTGNFDGIQFGTNSGGTVSGYISVWGFKD